MRTFRTALKTSGTYFAPKNNIKYKHYICIFDYWRWEQDDHLSIKHSTKEDLNKAKNATLITCTTSNYKIISQKKSCINISV